ncbi:Micos complex subunit [Thalictrum thalictroides]|uniref:Micos complex subunit n=1 Tax=Thalictrum thalictroides TaxID=46969 RepID=A0A7J6V3D8_THATH|nr:Micos complex subunit [Thalictrum thalictroides]
MPQGVLALEVALTRGLPIRKEVNALRNYLEGTQTQLQLYQQPYPTWWWWHLDTYWSRCSIQVKEDDVSGDGIESIINIVESFLVEGKYAEAADSLEGVVSGSEAEKFIGEWVKQARSRAITEQAITLLQSYATSTSVT